MNNTYAYIKQLPHVRITRLFISTCMCWIKADMLYTVAADQYCHDSCANAGLLVNKPLER